MLVTLGTQRVQCQLKCKTYFHRYTKKAASCPDPVLSKYQPDRYFGAVSEKFSTSVKKYTGTNPDKCLTDEDYEEK